MLFSRNELRMIEFCVLLAIERGDLGADAIKDATELLREIRLVLRTDPQAIGERTAEKVRAEMGD